MTYNDTKRLQFLGEASNPSIPLFRLMRADSRIPYGAKGVELLDNVFSPPSVPLTPAQRAAGQTIQPNEPFPLDRAVWYLRALGANEVIAHRGRQFPANATTSATSPAAPTGTPGSTGPGTVPAGLGMSSTTVNFQSSSEWYSIDFTVTYTLWLKDQLQKLVLPGGQSGTAKGLAGTKGSTGVLNDEKGRARWLQKWEYR